MPFKLIKLRNGKYQVKNVATERVVSKSTTKEKATRQIKFLNYLRRKERNKK